MSRLTRRELIQTGLGGLALLALGGCARPGTAVGAIDDPGYTYRTLTGGDRTLVAAVGAAMLAGALPPDTAARDVALVAVVRGVDVAIAGLPPSVQSEIGQLFGLLKFAPTRILTAGVWRSWQDAPATAVDGFLTRWRFSGFTLLRSGYQALHQLVMASWYGNGESWAHIAYPGPPAV